MEKLTSALDAASKFDDPLTLAIFFLGITGLGAIWLAITVVRYAFRNYNVKKE